MKRSVLLLFPVLALALAGCSGLVTPGSEPPPAPGQLRLTPSAAVLRGGDTQQFAVQTSDSSAPALTWAVNGTPGGSPALGVINASGLFTAPEFPPAGNSVTVSAVVTTDSSRSASSAVTLNNPVPVVASLNPMSIPVGGFTLTVNGAHFATGAQVFFGPAALATTRISSTQLTATGTALGTQVGTVPVTVKNPDPGTAVSSALNPQVTPATAITVTISPQTFTLRAGDRTTFHATVAGTTNTAVLWAVNGTVGGDGQHGTIDTGGNYFAPRAVPAPNTVTVTATSAADSSKKADGAVTLENPLPVVTAVSPGTIGVGAFLIAVTGSGFVPGSVIHFGNQALTTLFVSSAELSATGSASSAQVGGVPVTVANPNPGAATSAAFTAQVINNGATVSAAAAARFLEESSFGPTPESLNQLQQTGFDPYLQNQFQAPVSTYPEPLSTDTDLSKIQRQFFLNGVNDPDQLRLRVALALNELWVVSGNKVSDPTGYTNYLRALHKDALGNYYDVMRDITLTPAMGHFLDMVNNDKPGSGQHANENYARELMQLFTLGLNQLHPDGTPALDGSGNPLPTYTQDDVMALGRSLTGWTYPTGAGQTPQKHNPSFYGGPMVPFESNHDAGAKTFLGQPVSAGQSAAQELDSALTIIFNHPNLPPFVAKQLIEKLVTSNPSPAYIQRVASAFSSGRYQGYGSGKRGDMQALVAAILLDSEARRGDVPATADPADGKLREPVVMMIGLARAFHASTDGAGFTGAATAMSENLFNSGSVFNFFPPDYLIPQTTLNGPEWAIFNTNTSLARVNFVNTLVYNSLASTTKVDFTPVSSAGTPDQMVDLLNALLLHGSMSDPTRQAILTAVAAVNPTDTKNQARAAIYLVASSSQYQVER